MELILQLADARQVGDDVRCRFHVAVHHGRGTHVPNGVSLSMHIEPGGRSPLLVGHLPPHPVAQDLGAAPGERVLSRLLELDQDLANGEPADLGHTFDFHC